jgi:hypothetical protein
MKKLYIILFLLVFCIGFVGYAARIENEYFDTSSVALQAFSNNLFSYNSQESMLMNQEQLLTLGFLFGAGLIGLIIIRRK